MKFEKYQHVEKFDTIETHGIEDGMCYIFPKIDGTNGSVWNDENVICAGSRNRELTIESDNAGFYQWVLNQSSIINLLTDNPKIRLYGEWLVPHTIKSYRDEAWRKFYVFDVMYEENYLSYEIYIELLEKYGIDYIPAICKIKNPTTEKLIEMLDKNIYLIKDGEGTGEGIVIKNYEYKNRFGRQTWAKIVKNEFKDKHSKNGMFGITEIKCKHEIEEKIIEKFITNHFVEKEYSKIILESGGWSSKLIPKLLGIVFYCLIKEESWNILREFNNPVIDFKKLNGLCIKKIKELKPEIF